MSFVYRNLEALLYPIGFTWAALLVATMVFLRRKRLGAATFTGSLVLLLFLAGSTPLPAVLLARLERPYIGNTVANAPRADAVLVLGGFIDSSEHDAFGFTLNGAADRIVTGVELVRAEKAKTLLIGGGPSIVDGKPSSEGLHVAAWLKKWEAVGDAEIIGLPGCWNTREEAAELATLMRERRMTNVILVTSAAHMGRSLATFRKQGIEPHAVACDFEGHATLEGKRAGWRIVPIMAHLNLLGFYIHETFGWAYYRLRGWV
jgi:uncharacterized SAM-binding protein YcdF (DUF218 family)